MHVHQTQTHAVIALSLREAEELFALLRSSSVETQRWLSGSLLRKQLAPVIASIRGPEKTLNDADKILIHLNESPEGLTFEQLKLLTQCASRDVNEFSEVLFDLVETGIVSSSQDENNTVYKLASTVSVETIKATAETAKRPVGDRDQEQVLEVMKSCCDRSEFSVDYIRKTLNVPAGRVSIAFGKLVEAGVVQKRLDKKKNVTYFSFPGQVEIKEPKEKKEKATEETNQTEPASTSGASKAVKQEEAKPEFVTKCPSLLQRRLAYYLLDRPGIRAWGLVKFVFNLDTPDMRAAEAAPWFKMQQYMREGVLWYDNLQWARSVGCEIVEEFVGMIREARAYDVAKGVIPEGVENGIRPADEPVSSLDRQVFHPSQNDTTSRLLVFNAAEEEQRVAKLRKEKQEKELLEGRELL